MPTVLIVRHAQASFGAADYDVLSERGHEQATVLADELARRELRVDRVVSGRLARQRDTVAPVAAQAGCDVTVDPRWDEYDADAILAAHSTSEARQERAPGAPPISSREFQEVLDAALLAWIAAGSGSATAERWPAFADRVGAALTDAAAGVGRGGTVVVCTSAGVLAAACVALLGVPVESIVAFNRVAVNAGISKVIAGSRGTTLVSFNDHAHLERDGRALVTYR